MKIYAVTAPNKIFHKITQQGVSGATDDPTVSTITSAISRLDMLNERLVSLRSNLEVLADQIGGPRPAGDHSTQNPPSASVVGRLNDSAEYAHNHLSEIESLLGSIGRALG